VNICIDKFISRALNVTDQSEFVERELIQCSIVYPWAMMVQLFDKHCYTNK